MIDVVYWVRGQAYGEMAALSVASVKAVYPDATCYVYTDDKLTVPGALIARPSVARMPDMVANLEIQVRHMETAERDQPVLFLDADVLLKGKFPFGEEELYGTWRTTVQRGHERGEIAAKMMPYNYGVLGARVTPRAIEAFLWMRNRIAVMARHHQHWYGNQFALAELLCAPSLGESGRVPIPRTIYDCEARLLVRRLHCDTYNFTPEGPGEDVAGKVALHFKGGRKDLMEAYV